MATIKKEVGRKVQKTKIHLPTETKELLHSLPRKQRKAYMRLLVDKGWTLQSIAEVLGITRQAVDMFLKTNNYESWEADLVEAEGLPMPELPSRPIYKSQRAEANAEAIARLKELHEVAKLVRGNGKKHRAEADEFTRLAWEQVQQGISVYSLAKSLGLTTSALMFRFVRYGYATSNGKSKAYSPIKNKGAKENGNTDS